MNDVYVNVNRLQILPEFFMGDQSLAQAVGHVKKPRKAGLLLGIGP